MAMKGETMHQESQVQKIKGGGEKEPTDWEVSESGPEYHLCVGQHKEPQVTKSLC